MSRRLQKPEMYSRHCVKPVILKFNLYMRHVCGGKKTPYPVTPYPQKHQINQILKPAFIPLPLCMTDMLFTTRLCFQTLHSFMS